MKQLLLIVLLALPIFANSQDKKIEKEEDIDRDEMPEKIQQYLKENLPKDIKKLRHYYETDGDEESYETKFKFKGNRFSVEFNKNSRLEDIEVLLKEKALEKPVIKNIESYLENKHERFKIEKIQAQYLSKDDNEGETMKRAKKFKNSVPDNYELIVATKNEGKLKKFEMIFDESGNFKEEREIIRNSYDYLIF